MHHGKKIDSKRVSNLNGPKNLTRKFFVKDEIFVRKNLVANYNVPHRNI